jgi:hypothetical protein
LRIALDLGFRIEFEFGTQELLRMFRAFFYAFYK